MPEKPSPKAAATVNRPTSFCVNRKRDHRRSLPGRSDQHGGEAADAVGDRAPDLPAEEGGAEQHRQHQRRRSSGVMPRSLQKATRWPCGIAIGMQHSTAGAAHHREHDVGRPGRARASGCRRRRTPSAGWITSGGWRKIDRGQRHDDDDLGDRVARASSARQPKPAMARSNTGGHIAPAR